MLLREAPRRASMLERADHEDLVQRAILKALRQLALPGGPPLFVRARVTFGDELVDELRARGRHPEELTEEPPAQVAPGDPGDALAFRQTCRELRLRLGPEVEQYVLLKAGGHTDEQIATREGWDTQRVGAVRRRLQRTRDTFTFAPLSTPKKEAL